jgi:hypothetical protein
MQDNYIKFLDWVFYITYGLLDFFGGGQGGLMQGARPLVVRA